MTFFETKLMYGENRFVPMQGKLERVRDGSAGCSSKGEKQIRMENWHGNFCSCCLKVPGSDSWQIVDFILRLKPKLLLLKAEKVV